MQNEISLLRVVAAVLAVALVLGLLCAGCGAEESPEPEATSAARSRGDEMKAPDFPVELEWLNTTRPLRMEDLRGKFVLLDFWTYCCINCIHIIPDLKRLEEKYAQELVVIGIHSAKFTEERETGNIEAAIARYEIVHPVLNDHEMVVWQQYGARAWPTIVLIDPEGRIIHTMSGEGVFAPIDALLPGLIEKYEAAGLLDRTLPDYIQPGEKQQGGLLAFPGKVLADEASGRLFIADSNHNRILVVSLADNTIMETIGNGKADFKDGDFEEAQFDHPQGMALVGGKLYVADTENHAIREIDLAGGKVTTAAGTGEQAGAYNTGGAGKTTALSSPWDLVEEGGWLYIAMAGTHQIWRLELKSGQVEPYAGSGREARVDGPLEYAALAQPSGLTTDGKRLYFADSEVSAIRAVDLAPGGEVETIAGGDLFDYGDRDGVCRQARFQHPLGVVFVSDALYVADSYNNKIKRISPADGKVESFVGRGEPGWQDGEEALFFEPGGLSAAEGKLYIADTNNHAIRVVDLATKRTATLQLRRPEAKSAKAVLQTETQTIAPGSAKLKIALKFPQGYKLNAEAPSAVQVSSSNLAILNFGGEASATLQNPEFPAVVGLVAKEGEAELRVDFSIYYCGEAESLCYFEQATKVVMVKIEEGAKEEPLRLIHNVPEP